jgi:hypothetical protein
MDGDLFTIDQSIACHRRILIRRAPFHERMLSNSGESIVVEATFSPPSAIVGRMNPLRWIFQFAFGCRHRHLSRVFTIKGRTYKVCFDCGEEFDLADTRAADAA